MRFVCIVCYSGIKPYAVEIAKMRMWVHFKFANVKVCSQGVGAFQVCQCYGMWLVCGCFSSLPMLRYSQGVGAFQVCPCYGM